MSKYLTIVLIGLLFVLTPLVAMGSEGKRFELDRQHYTLDEIYRMISVSPNSESKVVKHPNPKFSSDTGYSYYHQTEGREVALGKQFKKQHEVRFDDGSSGNRVYRDKNGIVKIMSGYSPITKDEPFELSGIFSEISGEVVIDKLGTADSGYIVLLVREKKYKYYLMVAKKNNLRFSADISRSLFSKEALKRLDRGIQTGPQTWEKYFRAEPPGTYLPGSGPGAGFRPSNGSIINDYRSE